MISDVAMFNQGRGCAFRTGDLVVTFLCNGDSRSTIGCVANQVGEVAGQCNGLITCGHMISGASTGQ